MKGEGGRVGEHAAVAGKAEGPGREAKGKIERWEVKDTTVTRARREGGGPQGARAGRRVALRRTHSAALQRRPTHAQDTSGGWW